MRIVLAAGALAAAWSAAAQTGPVNGMRPSDLRTHAITNATVIVRPGETIEHATILMRDGVIEAVGSDVRVPAEARVWKGDGLRVYPGLIDPSVLVKAGEAPSGPGAHWNTRVRAQVQIADHNAPDKALRKTLRELGFTAAAVFPGDGIVRGSGAVLALADEDEFNLAYRPRSAMALGFAQGGGWGGAGERDGGYPGSLMGSIALLRQTLSDAQWHAACTRVWRQHPEGNEPPIRADALAALDDVVHRRQPVLFEVDDELNALRAARVAREFNLDMILLGSGTEFRRLDEVVALGMPLIVPLRFPETPKVASLAEADNISLRDMMTWEQAPTNARRLKAAGATIAITTHGLRNRSDFPEALRKAVQHGLSEDDALAALTTAPAELLGLSSVLGSIEPGKAANLLVVEGSYFDKKGKVRDVWVNGRRYEVSREAPIQLVARGVLATDLGARLPVSIDTKKTSVSVELPAKAAAAAAPDAEGQNKEPKPDKVSAKAVTVQRDQISFVLDARAFGGEGYARLAGVISEGAVSGSGQLPDGRRFTFTITPSGEKPDGDDAEKPAADAAPGEARAVADGGGGEEAAPGGVSGTWNVTLSAAQMPGGGMPMTIVLDQKGESVTGTATMRGREQTLENITFDAGTGKLRWETTTPRGSAVTEAVIEGDAISGTVTSEMFTAEFSGAREGGAVAAAGGDGKDEETFEMPPEPLVQPLGEYGLASPPEPRNVLLTNATIWTSGPQDIIENGWLLVNGGRIAGLGAGAPPRDGGPDPQDLGGRHITPGLIDCHSHTGIDGGVNEGAQVNTAEVRIGDCIDPDDINWYRELAGGLTAANQLHGSANPIGGQNSVVKLRWGRGAADYPVRDAIPGIKFALGENVTRNQNRYPNSRMGVETIYRDAFTAAREYRAGRDRYNSLSEDVRSRTMPPRRDLELDALAEILEGQRIIHCHSYRQDEILMLIRVAEHFGFRIGTFQHVLEGYKVAEAIARHGAGASSFSDWWAYKVEVMDAIPHNGSLMTELDIVVSFNSDSNELARRMNTEAAKAVRYGGLAPAEALKLVTINPAKQLRIDEHTGSLEVGKDADFVVWSGDPLSTYTRCEQTWIDGARYFDLEQDRELRAWTERERQRLTQKILAQAHGQTTRAKPAAAELAGPGSSAPGSPGSPAVDRPAPEPAVEAEPAPVLDVDDLKPTRLMARILEAQRQWMLEQVRRGRDPAEIRPGECGCNDFVMQMMFFSQMER
jgi:N-acetylglucosamine-6-phosphate deacetylase